MGPGGDGYRSDVPGRRPSDAVRVAAVATTAVAQILTSWLTPRLLGSDSATGTVADNYASP